MRKFMRKNTNDKDKKIHTHQQAKKSSATIIMLTSPRAATDVDADAVGTGADSAGGKGDTPCIATPCIATPGTGRGGGFGMLDWPAARLRRMGFTIGGVKGLDGLWEKES